MEEEEIQHIPDRKTGWVVESALSIHRFVCFVVVFFLGQCIFST